MFRSHINNASSKYLPMNRSAAVPSRSRPEPPGRVKVWTGGAISDMRRLGQPRTDGSGVQSAKHLSRNSLPIAWSAMAAIIPSLIWCYTAAIIPSFLQKKYLTD